jgi:long-chain acyl-CoA synthetase
MPECMTALPIGTYNDRFQEIVRRFPERTAFRIKTHHGYEQTTYAEAWRRCSGVARALAAMGLKPGARVAILSENRPEWVIAYLGVYFAGGTAVPLDAQLSPAEWKRLIDDSEAQRIFVSGALLPRLRETLQESHLISNLVCFDPLSGDRDARSELAGFIDWGASQPDSPALPEVKPADVAVIIYTSGTTGKPKGVMLTQGNIVAEISSVMKVIRADENDNLLCLLPLQHVFASILNVLIPLWLGAQVTFIDTLKRSEILEALQQAGISILATVPQFFYLFHGRIQEELKHQHALVRGLFRVMMRANRFCLRVLKLNPGKVFFRRIHRNFGSRLRLFVSGGSAFDARVAQDFYDLGFTILQGYGLTETTGGCSVTRVEDNVIGSVGKPLPGVDMEIADPGPDGIGEVRLRGPVVMKGYYKNPAATSEVIRDGWFYSGDLGRFDQGGNLFITGRRKEIIVLPNGKNIYPDEIETHYLQCPFIQEIAVIGVAEPGSHGGSERLHGVVVPDFDYLRARKIANAREILRDEIGKWSNLLPKYKRLMSYQIQKDPLPRTTTRKIKRIELKRLIESGQLRGLEAGQTAREVSPEDQLLLDSPVGQEVVRSIRENYHRPAVDLSMNLELDLGFDSMQRVELLAGLEQSLNMQLPDDFGAEIFTVRDLIQRLEGLAAAPGAGSARRQNWESILSEEGLAAEDGEWKVHFTGHFLSIVKFVCLRILYVLFRVFFRMEVRGIRNLPGEAPYLICPNHLSYIDPFVVMSVLPYRVFRKVFFVGASEYFENWYMKFLARLANIVPVDPDVHLLRAMKVGAYGLRRGRILCIFPEGARSFEGDVKEFKKGAAILAHEIGTPIVPVGLQGTYEVWPRGSMRIRLHKIKVLFGTPISADQGEPYRSDTERLRRVVMDLTKK